MIEFRQLSRKDFDHEITVNTRWGDMDALGHINHAKYLTYMENARIDYYASFGFGRMRQEQNPSIILGGMTIDYIYQLTHPSSLIICHRIDRVGLKSFDFLGAIFQENQDHPACTGLFKVISFNYQAQQTVEVPQEIRDNLYSK